jgi:purine-binding chemotaxis protein CheW
MTRYLTFALAEEKFAMPLLNVKEVIAVPEITPIPQTPPYFLGIMNLRGQIITVMDLRVKLGLKAARTSETAVVICDLAPYTVGVVVDSVLSVLAAAQDRISPKPELTGNKAEFIYGVYQSENELTLLLDLPKTLNLADHATMQRMVSQKEKQAA